MADMTREAIKIIKDLTLDRFSATERWAIDTLIKTIESYENADLIERKEILGKFGCWDINDRHRGTCKERQCEGCDAYAMGYEVFLDIPRFNPERQVDNE